MVLKWGG
jgi:inositol hexakisphosphate/diphosphoinositol-pentakisphosphate kinase